MAPKVKRAAESLALAALLLCASAWSQEKTVSDLPPAARKVLEGLNGGQKEALADLVREVFHPDAFARRSMEEYVGALWEVASTGGGVEAKNIWRAEPFSAVAILTTRKPVTDFRRRTAVRWLYFEASLAPAGDPQEGKIVDFTLQAVPNPDASADPGLTFPQEPMASESALLAEVRKWLERLASEDRFSGTIIVGKGDRIILRGAYGEAEKNHRVPNEIDSVFHMASATKMFTAVAVGQLVDLGKLGFDTRLGEVWPDYPNRAAAEKITMSQLLTHTSGLGEGLTPEVQAAGTPHRTLRAAVGVNASKPLLFEPGTNWSYSNLGYMVLGRVVELLTGMTYEAYVEKRILAPLGLARTGNYDLTTVVPGLAVGYGRQADDPLGIRERRAYWPLVLGFRGVSCGGYYSSAPDMFHFLRGLRTYKLTSRRTAELLVTGKWKLRTRQYAYGFWDLSLGGKPVRGHGGGGSGYGINTEANTFWTPGGEETDYAVVILSNYDPPTAQDLNAALLEFLAAQR